jgi:uncharacterized protein (TIGR02466 family)
MNYNLKLLFPTPVLETNIEVSKDVLEYVKSLEYIRTECNNANISKSMDVLNHTIMQNVSDLIDQSVKHYVLGVMSLDDKDLFIERVASWANTHEVGDWCQSHKHNNSYITGVWYLQTFEKCSDLTMDGWGFSPIFGFPTIFQQRESNEINSDSWDLKVSEGKLYIFPSVCRHSVGKNESKDLRISIAFNYYIRSRVISEDVEIKS